MFEVAFEQACRDHLQPAFETNHERTLYVRYVFRNSLIYGERGKNRLVRDGRSDHTDLRKYGRAQSFLTARARRTRRESACAAAGLTESVPATAVRNRRQSPCFKDLRNPGSVLT